MRRTRYLLSLASSLALALTVTALSTTALAGPPDGHQVVVVKQQTPGAAGAATSTPISSPAASPTVPRQVVVVPPIPTSPPVATPTPFRTPTPASTPTPRPTFRSTFATSTPASGVAPARAGGVSPGFAAMALSSIGALGVTAGLVLRRRRP